jgi:hypothetical protein
MSTVCAKWRPVDEEAEAEAKGHLPDADGYATIRQALAKARQTPGGQDTRDHYVPVPPSKWQAANATLPSRVWAAAKISRGDCFDAAAAGADWELFCASFVFGYGDVGVGPARFQKVVRRTAPNDLAPVIQQARHLLTSCCLLCAYDYVRGPDNHPTVPYWRAAFFTKLLYFADSSRHALILDNQVAWIVQQLSTMSFLGRRGQSRAWTTYRYAVYLHWMRLVAAKLDVPTDALEYALFGEARRQRPKLRRRGRPRTSLAGHVPVRAGAR